MYYYKIKFRQILQKILIKHFNWSFSRMKNFTSKINNKPYNLLPNFWCVKLFPLEQSPGDLLSSSSNNLENH